MWVPFNPFYILQGGTYKIRLSSTQAGPATLLSPFFPFPPSPLLLFSLLLQLLLCSFKEASAESPAKNINFCKDTDTFHF